MDPLIRHAAPADHTTIEQIENAADRLLIDRLEAGAWEAAPSGGSRAAAPGFLLVAEEASGGPVIGFVHVLEQAGHAHLEQLSVLPDHGQRGVGRALVRAAMDEAGCRGYREMSLRTYADVPWNAPFYARLGFASTTPTTSFQRRLAESEERLGLGAYGRRQQMTVSLVGFD
ncbi:MAG TPA: GNAT family N-acetyltransferase [Arthrobacter sp.]|nr:GNAT family N-acetyltransferase [Arthrobacter sp.]